MEVVARQQTRRKPSTQTGNIAKSYYNKTRIIHRIYLPSFRACRDKEKIAHGIKNLRISLDTEKRLLAASLLLLLLSERIESCLL